MIGLLGGAFDPPHLGHVALLAAAEDALGLSEVAVLVAANPGHRDVVASVADRLELAQAAFPGEAVRIDEHPRTIDLMRAHPEWEGAMFLIGADQFAGFGGWKEPDALLQLIRLGVATRPGVDRARLDEVCEGLADPGRVTIFEIEPLPISSTDVRQRVGRGESIEGLVPDAVREAIERLGLYAQPSSLH